MGKRKSADMTLSRDALMRIMAAFTKAVVSGKDSSVALELEAGKERETYVMLISRERKLKRKK